MLISCTTAKETINQDYTGDVHREVAEIIIKMPVSSPVVQAHLNEQLIETGRAGIRVLAGLLTVPGTGDDTYARYALSSLSSYVSRPGAESEREEFENAVLSELRGNYSAEAKTFLIQQLELTGSNRSVPVLEEFLSHERLFNPSLDLLVTLDSPQSVQAIQEALPNAEGARRIAIIKALGELQDSAAAEAIMAFASAEQWPLKRVSLYALANIGNPVAADLFSEVVDATGDDHQSEVFSFYLTYAERLASEGYPAESAEINYRILNGNYPENIKSSALSSLFQTEGDQMLDQLIDLGIASGPTLSAVALSRAGSIEGRMATDALAASLNGAPTERQADVIRLLGKRGDQSASSVIVPYLEDSSGNVRVAAAEALYRLGGRDHLPVIIQALNRAGDEEERNSVEAILLQMPTQELINESVNALPAAAETAKPALIRILAVRGSAENLQLIVQQADSENKDVRLEVYYALQLLGGSEDLAVLTGYLSPGQSDDEITAIQQAFVEIVNRSGVVEERNAMMNRILSVSTDNQKSLILATLPEIEGVGASHATGELNHSDESIRSAAMLALAVWRDPSVLPDLLDAAAVASNSARLKIYEGYVRLVNSSTYPNEVKVKLLHDLAGTTSSAQQKAEIVDSFSEAEDLVALEAASSFFYSDDEVVSERALDIASGILASSYESDAIALTISNAVLAVLDQPARSRLLEKLEHQAIVAADENTSRSNGSDSMKVADRPVYGQLFNGRNLDGWEPVGQNPDSWGVENGVLFTDGVGSGWLSTKSKYDDFIIELEFRVPEGGNSGVFIRAPREGNPAYAGMEIQILDDYADRYSDLEPYQYTGSIYNVKAPSKRVTKPAGEWQSMVIRAEGPEIQVTLNDELILNADLINHMELVEGHPGLVRRNGYIGLQNHSSRVDFRNIYILEISVMKDSDTQAHD